MTIGQEVGRAVGDAVPGVAPLRLAFYAVGGLLLAAFILWAGWRLFFADGQANRKSAEVAGTLATGREGAARASGQEAVRIIVDNNSRAAGIDRQTQQAIHDLLNAPGASQSFDPALGDVFRRSVCMYPSAAGTGSCRQVFGPGPGGLAD